MNVVKMKGFTEEELGNVCAVLRLVDDSPFFLEYAFAGGNRLPNGAFHSFDVIKHQVDLDQFVQCRRSLGLHIAHHGRQASRIT